MESEIEKKKIGSSKNQLSNCSQGLVYTVLKHLRRYVANFWRSLERLIDTAPVSKIWFYLKKIKKQVGNCIQQKKV